MGTKPIITTYLEMQDAGQLRPKRIGDPRFRVDECLVKQWRFNRFLYLTVGAEWSWNDKRGWEDEQWRGYAESDQLRTIAAYHAGSPAGYYELALHSGNEIEIAYFGLMPGFLGQGLGGTLLTHALEFAWNLQPSRVWVHTCTLDHPAALSNYLARGMSIYKTETHDETPQG